MDRFEELRLRYMNSLPQKGRDLRAQWQRWSAQPQDRSMLAELHQQVHRLSGSAPAYGFEEIGSLARPVDASIAEWLRAEPPSRDGESALMKRLAQPVEAIVCALVAAAEIEAAVRRRQ